MPKENMKSILNKIPISEMFPNIIFQFKYVDFILKGDGANFGSVIKRIPSYSLSLRGCYIVSGGASVKAHVDVLPYEEYIKESFVDDLTPKQKSLYQKENGWSNIPEECAGHGYVLLPERFGAAEACITLYCTEKEFQFIQNMIIYNSNVIGIAKKTCQELYFTVRISHPDYMNENGKMKSEFYEEGIWYSSSIFCIDNWSMQLS